MTAAGPGAPIPTGAALRDLLAAAPARAHGDHPAWSRRRGPAAADRRAGVLLAFSDGTPATGPDVLLTERSRTLRSHAGQVSFPGGRVDPSDDGAVAAALREAHEEVGLAASEVTVLGTLPDVALPTSGNVVTPVLGWWDGRAAVGPVDAAEVASVVRVPLAELVDPAHRFTTRHPSGYLGPGFRAGGLYVWGFTGGLLAWTLRHAGLELAWDERVTQPLPADVLAMLPSGPR